MKISNDRARFPIRMMMEVMRLGLGRIPVLPRFWKARAASATLRGHHLKRSPTA